MAYHATQFQKAYAPLEILIVEDNPGDVIFAREALSEVAADSHVSVANNGVEALAFLRREGNFADAPRPDLILLDLNLPRKDGRETLAEIKQDQNLSAIPLVIVTVSENERFLLAEYDLPPNSYLTKTLDLNVYTQLLLSLDILASEKRLLPFENESANQFTNERDASGKGEEQSNTGESAAGALNILLVEDNPGDAGLMQEYLSEARGTAFTISHITRLRQLRERVTETRFDIILLDLSLPDTHGLETLTRVHEEAPDTPIIVITGDANVTQGVQAIQAGALDYLLKDSIRPDLLTRTLDNAIAKHRLSRQIKAQYAELEAQRMELEAQRVELKSRNVVLEAANKALKVSEKRYEGMVANIPGMIYRYMRHRATNTSEFLYVSEGCRALFGIAPEQIRADPLTLRRMVHPDEAEAYDRAGNIANAQAQPWRWQGRFVLPSGEVKIIQGMGHPDSQENGDLIWDGLMMDVTEQVQAEHKAAQLAAIVENSVDAIKSKTLDGIITSWNKAAERMYGYTAEEMIGQPITRILLPDRAQEMDDLLRKVARGESVQSDGEARLAKDGTIIDIALTISPVKDSAGKIIGAASIAQDIRQRKEGERRLRQSMQRLNALRTIDIAITSSLDARVTLNVFLDQVTTQLQADAAAVLLLNPHTHHLTYTLGRGFRTREIQSTDLRVGEGYAGLAAQEKRLLHIPNLNEAGVNFLRPALRDKEGFVAYWAVPLLSKGRAIGALEVFHRSPLHGDEDWLGFLEALAGQAAIAVENATLFNDLQRSNTDLQIAYDSTLEGWSKALDLRDKETEGHTLRVTEGAMILARAMHIRDEALMQIRRGALLHDIGKMGVPDAILRKPGALSPEEWEIMKQHPVFAYELLAPIPFLQPALDIPYCHHEKWDGSGYPRGLKGEQIPLSARIFAVVDVWDALCSDRPYRSAWPVDRVRDHIAQGSGSHFDPQVVETFLSTEL